MNFLTQLTERIGLLEKNSAGATYPGAMLASSKIKQTRLSICNSCEFLSTTTMRCTQSGNLVNVETSIAPIGCPINKWPANENT